MCFNEETLSRQEQCGITAVDACILHVLSDGIVHKFASLAPKTMELRKCGIEETRKTITARNSGTQQMSDFRDGRQSNLVNNASRDHGLANRIHLDLLCPGDVLRDHDGVVSTHDGSGFQEHVQIAIICDLESQACQAITFSNAALDNRAQNKRRGNT